MDSRTLPAALALTLLVAASVQCGPSGRRGGGGGGGGGAGGGAGAAAGGGGGAGGAGAPADDVPYTTDTCMVCVDEWLGDELRRTPKSCAALDSPDTPGMSKLDSFSGRQWCGHDAAPDVWDECAPAGGCEELGRGCFVCALTLLGADCKEYEYIECAEIGAGRQRLIVDPAGILCETRVFAGPLECVPEGTDCDEWIRSVRPDTVICEPDEAP